MGSSQDWNQLGPIARFVEDLALILPLIAGPDWSDPYVVPAPLGAPDSIELRKLRISFHTDNGVAATTETVRECVRKAARALSVLGSVVEEIPPPGIPEFLADRGPSNGGALVRSVLKSAGTADVSEVSPFLRFFFNPQAKSASAAELEAYIVRTSSFRSRMLSFMEKFDVIVCPAFGQPAPSHGFSTKRRFPQDVSYTWVYNVTGWPAAVVRCGMSPDGLPIGVQIVARPFREDVALAVALNLERELGGFKPPAL
jgi:amidase